MVALRGEVNQSLSDLVGRKFVEAYFRGRRQEGRSPEGNVQILELAV